MWRLILLLGVVALIAAVKFLPWWAIVLVVVGLVLAGKLLGGKLIELVILRAFKAKGAVLRKANALVHLVVRASPLEKSAEDEENDEESKEWQRWPHYLVDATITPQPKGSGGFQMWEPGELWLVPAGTKPLNPSGDDEEPSDVEIVRLEIEEDGGFKQDEGMKYGGARRLRALVAVKPGTPRLMFRYYFEDFGEVLVPEGAAQTRANAD
jgi:hypothetical protein